MLGGEHASSANDALNEGQYCFHISTEGLIKIRYVPLNTKLIHGPSQRKYVYEKRVQYAVHESKGGSPYNCPS